ncbi:hypothetical protein ES332_A08G134700v1 [Gossypium tomentosum]|nr:hypothetical protein ES332_A08G134700v1 [Gossypium tomentosum]TYI14643.1 hypothetical protein ES332_A08G134700v1 [Gossypium tomentosum]
MQSQQLLFFFPQHFFFFFKNWVILNLLHLVLLASVAPSPDGYSLDATPAEATISPSVSQTTKPKEDLEVLLSKAVSK